MNLLFGPAPRGRWSGRGRSSKWYCGVDPFWRSMVPLDLGFTDPIARYSRYGLSRTERLGQRHDVTMDQPHQIDGEDLYQSYLRFVRDSHESILEILEQEESREFFSDFHRPLPRREFERRVQRMSHDVRTRYIRRLRSGYALATLAEGRRAPRSPGTPHRN